MNILQIIPYYFLSWSDTPVELIEELSKHLIKNGHNVTIYTTDMFNNNYYKNDKFIEYDGIKIYEFHNLIKYPLCFSLNMMRMLSLNIKNFDIIHLHEYRTVPNIITHYYATKNNIPYILEAHGSLPLNINNIYLKKFFDYTIGNLLLKDASNVIALTQTEFNQYKIKNVPDNKIKIIPNGIDLNEYQKLPCKGKFRKQYFIKDEEKIILYLGRLDATKGIDILIEAFSYLIKEIKNTKLIIIGKDYGHLNILKKLTSKYKITNKTIFTGFLSKDFKKAAFIDSDVFVTPSYYGFPHTFLEACACGLPIITTKKGDELDWINNKVGFVTNYDANDLAYSILKILNDDKLKNKFSISARLMVEENYNWPIVVKKIENLYDHIININK